MKKAWKWLLAVTSIISIGLLVSPLVMYIYFTYAYSRLTEDLRAAGQPVYTRDLAEPEIPNSQNAAYFFMQAASQVPQPEATKEAFKKVQEAKTPLEEKAFLLEWQEKVGNRAVVPPELTRGVTLERAQYDIDWTLPAETITFKHLAELRLLAQYTYLLALQDAHAGRISQCLEKVHLLYQLAENRSTPEGYIGFLVFTSFENMGHRVLQRSLSPADIPEEKAVLLTEYLADRDMHNFFTRALAVERAMETSFLEERFSDASFSSPSPISLFIVRSRVTITKNLERAMVLSELPYSLENQHELEKLSEPRGITNAFAAMAMWGLDRQQVYAFTCEARNSMAQAALGLQVYRQRYGEYPQSLEDLKRIDWPPIPPDPFTQKPLVYQKHGSTYRLYSLGPNQKDDTPTDPAKTPDENADDIQWGLQAGDS